MCVTNRMWPWSDVVFWRYLPEMPESEDCSFRAKWSVLTIGVQKQSQVSKVGCKDAYLLLYHASKLLIAITSLTLKSNAFFYGHFSCQMLDKFRICNMSVFTIFLKVEWAWKQQQRLVPMTFQSCTRHPGGLQDGACKHKVQLIHCCINTCVLLITFDYLLYSISYCRSWQKLR